MQDHGFVIRVHQLTEERINFDVIKPDGHLFNDAPYLMGKSEFLLFIDTLQPRRIEHENGELMEVWYKE